MTSKNITSMKETTIQLMEEEAIEEPVLGGMPSMDETTTTRRRRSDGNESLAFGQSKGGKTETIGTVDTPNSAYSTSNNSHDPPEPELYRYSFGEHHHHHHNTNNTTTNNRIHPSTESCVASSDSQREDRPLLETPLKTDSEHEQKQKTILTHEQVYEDVQESGNELHDKTSVAKNYYPLDAATSSSSTAIPFSSFTVDPSSSSSSSSSTSACANSITATTTTTTADSSSPQHHTLLSSSSHSPSSKSILLKQTMPSQGILRSASSSSFHSMESSDGSAHQTQTQYRTKLLGRPATPRRVKGLWETTTPVQMMDASPITPINGSSANPFDSLRDDTLLHILTHLDLADLLACGMVSRRWRYHIRIRNNKAISDLTSSSSSSSSSLLSLSVPTKHYRTGTTTTATLLKKKNRKAPVTTTIAPPPVIPYDPTLYPLWKRIDASSFVQRTYHSFLSRRIKAQQQQQQQNDSVDDDDDDHGDDNPHSIAKIPPVTFKKEPSQWAREQTGKALAQVLQGRTPHTLIIREIESALCANHFELPPSLLAGLRELTLTHFDAMTDTHLHVLLLLTLGGSGAAGGAMSPLPLPNTKPGNVAPKKPSKPRSYNNLRILRLEYCKQLTNNSVASIAKTCQKHLRTLSLKGNLHITSMIPLQGLLVTRLREDKIDQVSSSSCAISNRWNPLSAPPILASPSLLNKTAPAAPLTTFLLPPSPPPSFSMPWTTTLPPSMCMADTQLPMSSLPPSLQQPIRNHDQFDWNTARPPISHEWTNTETHGVLRPTNSLLPPPPPPRPPSPNNPSMSSLFSPPQTALTPRPTSLPHKGMMCLFEPPSIENVTVAEGNESTPFPPTSSKPTSSSHHTTSASATPLESLFDPPGSSPLRATINLTFSPETLSLPPTLAEDPFAPPETVIASQQQQQQNDISSSVLNPVMLHRYHLHRRCLSNAASPATTTADGMTDTPNTWPPPAPSTSAAASTTSALPVAAVASSYRIGSLDKLDIRGTSIPPQDVLDCLWGLASHPPKHGTTSSTLFGSSSKSSATSQDDWDNLWCWVCFKSLLLGEVFSNDRVMNAPSSVAPVVWTQEETELLKLVVDMDEAEELLIGKEL
ncbi:F-box domain containing protein [Nitzschia inconspicua]|uniref:F-box domain containing protein n=1 Tax=Nitzschia inconspicua TaxID=303405 RepID=A0A9K3KL49_9STRA|nr:F-box domain containing protein [Nitzschia inconspicua]